MVARTLSRWTPVLSVVELTLPLNNPSQWQAHKINIINECALKGCFITACHCRLKKCSVLTHLNGALFLFKAIIKHGGKRFSVICHPKWYELGKIILKSERSPQWLTLTMFFSESLLFSIQSKFSHTLFILISVENVTFRKEKKGYDFHLTLSLYCYLETPLSTGAYKSKFVFDQMGSYSKGTFLLSSTSGLNLSYFIYRPRIAFSLRGKDNKYFLVPPFQIHTALWYTGLCIKIKKAPV